MKYLFIIRHGKAERYLDGQEDHDRILVDKGIRRVLKLSEWLKNISPKIEKIYYSSSKRTTQTAELIKQELSDNIHIEEKPELYGASLDQLINFLLYIDDDSMNSMCIVGHEPGLKQLAIYLAGAYGKGLENVLNNHFSTSNSIVLVLNITRWDQISERIGTISHYHDSLNM